MPLERIVSDHTDFPSSKNAFLEELETLSQKFNQMQPELELTVCDKHMGINGYVVVWNTGICKGGPFDKNGKGCGKGGTRVMAGLKMDDVKRLARTMAEKNAAAGLPLGGSKSGVDIDPNDPNYEIKYRRFVALVKEQGVLFEDGGIFGGFGYDIGGRPPLNAKWACDELGSLNSFTGKPVDMGGTDYDREGIAGLGVAVAGKALCAHKNLNINETSFAVQGLGAMGGAVIRYFCEYGGKLKAIGDPRLGGTWTFESAASDTFIEAVIAQDFGAMTQILNNEARQISDDPSEVLYTQTDILFPCALEDAIAKDNVGKIKAPYIVEGANNPTTLDAKEILFQNNQVLVPDILVNPGGIIAAFVELSSDISVEENTKTRAKVLEAKKLTEDKVYENVITMLGLVDQLGVRPDLVAKYMTYKNIFKHEEL